MKIQQARILAYNSKKAIKSILSTENTVYNVNTENQKEYKSTDLLNSEKNEWFYIDNFRESNYNTSITEIGSQGIKVEELFKYYFTELNQLQSEDYPSIKWLITKQGECYYFQKVLSSSRIKNKKILWLSLGSPQIQEINNSVEIHREHPDIIYDSTADKLIFKDLSRAKGMFPKLIDLYREAKNEEVEGFISNRTDILISKPFEIGARNRKEVARLLPKIEALSDEARNILTRYVDDHIGKTNLQRGDDGKIIISNPTDFKEYIALLDERFIVSEVYGESRRVTAFTTM